MNLASSACRIAHTVFGALVVALVATLSLSCQTRVDEKTPDGKIVLEYWEKWSGFEGEAMQKVVDAYNESQSKYFVRMTTTSAIDRKLLVATAAGDPPDIAGIWTWAINIYADKEALTDLTPMIEKAGIRADSYLPIYWKFCSHRGRQWGLPSTVATIGLHWNKRLFREAGLDPNKPPKTIAEVDTLNDSLTYYKLPSGERKSFIELGGKVPEGSEIVQMGFLPFEPGWFNWTWGYFFGGDLWNGKDKITCTDAGHQAAMEWVQRIMKRYGKEQVQKFFGSFAGVFASSQNAFMCGKIAMVMQGVWMYNFIDKYSAGMDWGVTGIPTHDGKPKVYAEADVMVIPKGARHPEAAFEFIQFVNTQKGMEMLALGQRKFSPLRVVSDSFYKEHPHPYIQVFRDLAEEKDVFTTPATGIWNELGREFGIMFEQVQLLKSEPGPALEEMRVRVQEKLDLENERLTRRGKMPS